MQEHDAGSAWHALAADDVLERLDVDPERGLDSGEAADRRARFGPNELAGDEPPGNLEILLRQFKSPLIYILLVAAVVTVAIGEYIDTGVIVAVLVLNALVGFVQERKADRSVRALMELAAPTSRVLRDGRRQDVESRCLVPGDIVLLESGTRVPADLRVISATALQVDESLLTGESLPVKKAVDPVDEDAGAGDRTSMAHMGSIVASGRGLAVVVATAAATELGKIAERIRGAEQPESPLTRRMQRFANIVAVAVAGSAVATFLLGLAVGEPPTEVFMTAVALAVAIVPEGLPVAVTVAMALGVRRMAQRNAIIRTLPAVETLGSTNTIGSDKTGTLTQNRMTVQRAWVAGSTYTIDPGGAGGEGGAGVLGAGAVSLDGTDPVSMTLLAGVLTNEADLAGWEDGVPETRGDPTEAALLVAASVLGVDPGKAREAYPAVAEIPFEPGLRYSMSIRKRNGEQVMFVKGAPERVLELSSRMAGPDGEQALDRDAVLEAAHALAGEGLRVLAMGYRTLEADVEDPDDPPEPSDLVLCGLQGMLDPPRPGVAEAIEDCKRAGVRVLMITGDHAATAHAIARDLRLVDEGAPCLTGADIEPMSDEELREHVLEVAVFARVSPDHKYRIVEALRSHGQVVAVTGDGVNDGPALKAAHIGVAMGRGGTDVAREASDMVLSDDNFVSITGAIEEGRVVFDNVRKVTYFLLSTGAAAIVAILYALVAGLPLPFLPAQLLWLNVVTNGLQDVALAFEPKEAGVLARPPRRRDEPVVSRLLWERTAFTGVTMAIGALVLYQRALAGDMTLEQARTVALTAMVISMAFHVHNARSERQSVFRMNPLGNPFLLAATLGALTVHWLAVHWGPTQFVLRVEPLAASTWMLVVAVAVSVLAVSELHKLVRSRP